MTWGQWLFEYQALRKKEEESVDLVNLVMKNSARIVHDVLVGVLGLRQLVPEELQTAEARARAEGKAASDPDLAPPFVPAVFAMGNHHLLQHLLEQKEKAAQTNQALQDEAFEEFSKKLARGDVSDMDPILAGNIPMLTDPHAYWKSEGVQAALRSLGVKTRSAGAPAVPHKELTRKPTGVFFDEEGEE